MLIKVSLCNWLLNCQYILLVLDPALYSRPIKVLMLVQMNPGVTNLHQFRTPVVIIRLIYKQFVLIP